MKPRNGISKIIVAAVAVAAFLPSSSFACAACYARSDSPLASAMNWGIFTLLGVVVTVLATIAGFFIYLIRKEAGQASSAPVEQKLSEVKV